MLQVAINIRPNEISPIQNVGVYASNIAGVILTVAAFAAFIYLVYGGLRWIMAGSDAGKVEEARNQITNALLGLAVAALAWAVFLLIDYFLGINIAGRNNNSQAPTSITGAAAGSDCGGGLSLNQEASLNGVRYRCVEAGTACGSGNPDGYNYRFNCPVQCVGKTDVSCR